MKISKFAKTRLIGSIFCLIIGLISILISFFGKDITNELKNYLFGFAFGVIFVGIYFLIYSIILVINPKKNIEAENLQKDERILSIFDKSLSISFRITLISEALASIVCAFLGYMFISKVLGILISFELIIYLVTYIIISRKN